MTLKDVPSCRKTSAVAPLALHSNAFFLRSSPAAIRDYEFVMGGVREKGGAAYGDALCELGYAEMLNGEGRLGVNRMEQGLELLKAAPPSGFTIRAVRKLALGYTRRQAGKGVGPFSRGLQPRDGNRSLRSNSAS
jgi:hypothetical protein